MYRAKAAPIVFISDIKKVYKTEAQKKYHIKKKNVRNRVRRLYPPCGVI